MKCILPFSPTSHGVSLLSDRPCNPSILLSCLIRTDPLVAVGARRGVGRRRRAGRPSYAGGRAGRPTRVPAQAGEQSDCRECPCVDGGEGLHARDRRGWGRAAQAINNRPVRADGEMRRRGLTVSCVRGRPARDPASGTAVLSHDGGIASSTDCVSSSAFAITWWCNFAFLGD
jgi:hypothetical protein